MTAAVTLDSPMGVTAAPGAAARIPVDPSTSETDAQRNARFTRDVIPLMPRLSGNALRMTRNRVDAEDLLQDTVMRAYLGFGSFRPDSNLNAWLNRILLNTHRSTHRNQQRRPTQYPADELTDWQQSATAEHTSGGLRSAEVEALDRLPDNDIRAAVQQLPIAFQLVLFYADVADRPYAEIAGIMNTPIGTVMSRLHRARRQLRSLLSDTDREHPRSVPHDDDAETLAGGHGPRPRRDESTPTDRASTSPSSNRFQP